MECIMRRLSSVILCFLLVSGFTSAAYARWTYLIFLNGRNQLAPLAVPNIKAMEAIGSSKDINIVLQWGDYSTRKAVRMLIQKSNDPTHITSPILADLGDTDMGDYKNLEAFIAWGVQKFPADHYFIEIWAGGGGWHSLAASRDGKPTTLTDISYDTITGNKITTAQLGLVIDKAADLIGHKVDIFGSDANSMAMIEVADQLSHSANFYVGSEQSTPGEGWPYTDFLRDWEAFPQFTPAQVSMLLVEDYAKLYQNTANASLSAFDLSKLPAFNMTLTRVSTMIGNLSSNSRALLLQAAQAVTVFDSGDVSQLICKINDARIPGLDHYAVNDVITATKDLVVGNWASDPNLVGVSIWLPSKGNYYYRFIDRYKQLQFQRDTAWGDALTTMVTP
jgi:hypothetical protein